jgi:glycosyltransferase involved in cell wall biosynthesis
MMIDLTIVVPLYNEEESVELLYDAIVAATIPIGQNLEFIFVDDGSTDNTFEVAAKIGATDKRLRVVKFRRNYGQTPAMAAGIDLARGRVVITMDGDLQNDPSDIPKFVAKLNEGYDIVVGWRFDRKDKLISRKIPSRAANWLIGKVTGVRLKDNGCSLKAFRADLIKQVPLYSDMHRFIPAMASIAGPRIAELKVNHNARQFGESKYGISRVYKVLLDLMTIKTLSTFTTRPLVWFTLLAAPFFVMSGAMLIGSVATLGLGGTNSLPMAGAGLFFGTLSVFLVLTGGLAEMIINTGRSGIGIFPLITAKEFSSASESSETE